MSRLCCTRCLRPGLYCVCPHVVRVKNRTRVLILQHVQEQRHPLNTGRLAALSLQNCELWVGEYFPRLAEEIVASPSASLLFPGPGACIPSAPARDVDRGSALLIVPDGTWRKARKIVHANPVLSSLPWWQLPAGEPSRYRVRKTNEAAAVSTIEAIVRTLSALEPDQDFQPLLKPFDALIEQQIAAMGNDVYQRNHARSE